MRTYQEEIQAERERFAFLVQRDGLEAAIALTKRNRSIYRNVCRKRDKDGTMVYPDPGKDRGYRTGYVRGARAMSIILREHR